MNAPGGAGDRYYFYISARAMRSKWRRQENRDSDFPAPGNDAAARGARIW